MPSPAEYGKKIFKAYAFVRPTVDEDGNKLSRQASAEAQLNGIHTFCDQDAAGQRYVIAQILYLLLQQMGASTDTTRELVTQINEVLAEPAEQEPEGAPEPSPEPEPEAAESTTRRRGSRLAPHLQVLEDDDDNQDPGGEPHAG